VCSYLISVCALVRAVVTITSGLISYPIDTIRRRMMMTSGEAVKYSGSIDCCVKIVRAEGFMTLMKGAGKCVGHHASLTVSEGGSVAEWLACWTQA